MTGGRQVFRFGEYQMDTAVRELRRGDLLIPIAPSLYDTLLALLEQAGTAVAPHDLLLRVWPDRFVEEEHLARSIFALQKVLGTLTDGRPYIESHPRHGYRFAAEVEELDEVSSPALPVVEPVPVTPRPAPRPRIWRSMWVVRALVAGALALGVGYWLTAVAAELP